MKMNKKCVHYQTCQNGNEGCIANPLHRCVRFLPITNTNYTKISGVVETPPEVDDDVFSQLFVNWIDSMGWKFAGGTSPYYVEDWDEEE